MFIFVQEFKTKQMAYSKNPLPKRLTIFEEQQTKSNRTINTIKRKTK